MRLFRYLPVLALLALGCSAPEWGDPGFRDIPPPPVTFSWSGSSNPTTIAGSTGTLWGIRCQTSKGVKWRLSGPGSLAIATPPFTAYTQGSLAEGSSGLYIPPDDVPSEGMTVTLGVDVINLIGGWESSPNYPVKVIKRTDPMSFNFRDANVPREQTLRPGESFTCPDIAVVPMPRTFDPAGTLFPSIPGAPAGSLTINTYKVVNERCTWTYTAPPSIPQAMDVTVRLTGWDPWAKREQIVDYKIHLVN